MPPMPPMPPMPCASERRSYANPRGPYTTLLPRAFCTLLHPPCPRRTGPRLNTPPFLLMRASAPATRAAVKRSQLGGRCFCPWPVVAKRVLFWPFVAIRGQICPPHVRPLRPALPPQDMMLTCSRPHRNAGHRVTNPHDFRPTACHTTCCHSVSSYATRSHGEDTSGQTSRKSGQNGQPAPGMRVASPLCHTLLYPASRFTK